MLFSHKLEKNALSLCVEISKIVKHFQQILGTQLIQSSLHMQSNVLNDLALFCLGRLFGLFVFCVVFVAFGVVCLFAVFLNGS